MPSHVHHVPPTGDNKPIRNYSDDTKKWILGEREKHRKAIEKTRSLCESLDLKGGCSKCPLKQINCGHGGTDTMFDFDTIEEILHIGA